MGELQKFLEESHHKAEKWRMMGEIHIILGNEAGDLDSVMSTIAYAYFLRSVTKQEPDREIAFLPVLNFSREDMDLRFEHQYLFKQVNINLDKLIYRPQLNFEEMAEEFQKTNKQLHTYLVDHHQLAEKDEVLKNYVCRIFDHRPLDQYYCCCDQNLVMRLEEVASCSTLIAEEIYKDNKNIFTVDLAYLLLCTIIYDMKGCTKYGSLEEEIKTKLRTISGCHTDSKTLYLLLEDYHSKIDGLTPLQILRRDLKFQNGILFPRLTISAEDFIKLDGAYNDLETLCRQYNSELAVLICGIKKLKGIHCDVGVFFMDLSNSGFMGEFIRKMNECNLSHVRTNFSNFIVFQFCKHGKMGRKKMLPLILKIHDDIKSNVD